MMYTHICICKHIHIHTFYSCTLLTLLYVRNDVHTCMYLCVYICVYIYIYIYIHGANANTSSSSSSSSNNSSNSSSSNNNDSLDLRAAWSPAGH